MPDVLWFALLCPLTGLAHYSASFVFPAGSLWWLGALSSQGLSPAVSPGQQSWKETLSHLSWPARLCLQAAPPAPAANQVLLLHLRPATKTLWYVSGNYLICRILGSSCSTCITDVLSVFPRVMPKPRQTRRPATGRSTSTLSSTLSVLPVQWKSRRWRNPKIEHHPLMTQHQKHQQRRGLEKCPVRLIGKLDNNNEKTEKTESL